MAEKVKLPEIKEKLIAIMPLIEKIQTIGALSFKVQFDKVDIYVPFSDIGRFESEISDYWSEQYGCFRMFGYKVKFLAQELV